MKKSNIALLCLGTFVVGVFTGLLWAAFKGPPPGLEHGASIPGSMGKEEGEHTHDIEAHLAALNERIKSSPDEPGPYIEAGNILFDNNQFEDGLDYYRGALKLTGEEPNLLTDMGVANRKLGRPEKAADFFRRAMKADPQHQQSAYNLGVVLLHDIKDKNGALKAWRHYLSLGPQDQRADMIRKVVAQIEQELGSN